MPDEAFVPHYRCGAAPDSNRIPFYVRFTPRINPIYRRGKPVSTLHLVYTSAQEVNKIPDGLFTLTSLPPGKMLFYYNLLAAGFLSIRINNIQSKLAFGFFVNKNIYLEQIILISKIFDVDLW